MFRIGLICSYTLYTVGSESGSCIGSSTVGSGSVVTSKPVQLTVKLASLPLMGLESESSGRFVGSNGVSVPLSLTESSVISFAHHRSSHEHSTLDVRFLASLKNPAWVTCVGVSIAILKNNRMPTTRILCII